MSSVEDGQSRSQALSLMAAAVEEFRKLDPTIPAQAVIAFLYIARHEGCSTSDVGEALGLSQASSSRNVGVFLRERVVHGKVTKGHDLVTQNIDAHNRRRRIICLTPKGRRVADSIVQLMGAET